MGLEEERKKTTFNHEELTSFLYLNYLYPQLSLEHIRAIREKALKVPELNYSLEKYHDNRVENITRALKNGIALKSFCDAEKLDIWERRYLTTFYPELTPHQIQYKFVIPSFILQASEEQQAKWLPRMENLEILGCYAQTELGHGSNVKGIETLAIYDEKSMEFIFHSPKITSYKWWIGGLGILANYAMVVAKLIIKGKDHGIHTFFVQIRDMETHRPLDGIHVGDIGPKFGLNGIDNGFLRFEYFRAPSDSMLNRFAKINSAGKYVLLDPNGVKILYTSMVSARVGILSDSWLRYSMALTISIRYSLIREQFIDYDNPLKERKILDYQIQRFKLFKNLSKLYGHVFAKKSISDRYFECEKRLFKNDDSMLHEVHILSSLYKAYITKNTVEGIEECRRSCGGHGYMMLSGLASLYANHLPAMTYEGDNNILALQSARYFATGLNAGVFGFLNTPIPQITGFPDIRFPEFHQVCFEAIAKFKLRSIIKKEQDLAKRKIKKQKIWEEHLQVEGIELSEAVYHASMHRYFVDGIKKIENIEIKQAIEYLRLIYVTTELETYKSVLVRLGIKIEIFELLSEIKLDALDKTRPNALALIEAFDIPDQVLNSVIGPKDGNIYQNMAFMSKEMNPINKYEIFPGIERYLRPKL